MGGDEADTGPLPDSLPAVIPLFPLQGALLLPRAELPLNIFEPRYLAMVQDAMNADQVIGIIQPRDTGDQSRPGLYSVGCAGKIMAMVEADDGRRLITLRGLTRFAILDEMACTTAYRQARVTYDSFKGDLLTPARRAGIDRERFIDTFTRFLERQGLNAEWSAVDKAPDELLVNSLAMVCPFSPAEKQALLEADGLKERTATMIMLMEFVLAEAIKDDEDEDDDWSPLPN